MEGPSSEIDISDPTKLPEVMEKLDKMQLDILESKSVQY